MLVVEILRAFPDFLVEGRAFAWETKYGTQEERIRNYISRLCEKERLSVRRPTHISQNAVDNVEVYQDAIAYANMYLKLTVGL